MASRLNELERVLALPLHLADKVRLAMQSEQTEEEVVKTEDPY